MIYAVGIDIGYSDVKAATGNKKISFPSAVGVRSNREIAELSQSHARTFSIVVKGQEYMIGESALAFTEAVRRETRNYQETPEWYILLLAALTELGIPSGSQIILGTGLPISFWSKEAAAKLRGTLEGIHEVERNGLSYQYHIARAIVQAQFYGSATTALVERYPIADFLEDEFPVAVADGGGRTWNFGVVKEMRIVSNSTFSADLGAWNAVRNLSYYLSRRFERDFKDHEVMKALRTKKVWNYRNVDIQEEVELALDDLAAPIRRIFTEQWQKVIPTTSALFFTGGTPLLLGDRLSDLHENVFYGQAFDNALGYKTFAELKRDEG